MSQIKTALICTYDSQRAKCRNDVKSGDSLINPLLAASDRWNNANRD